MLEQCNIHDRWTYVLLDLKIDLQLLNIQYIFHIFPATENAQKTERTKLPEDSILPEDAPAPRITLNGHDSGTYLLELQYLAFLQGQWIFQAYVYYVSGKIPTINVAKHMVLACFPAGFFSSVQIQCHQLGNPNANQPSAGTCGPWIPPPNMEHSETPSGNFGYNIGDLPSGYD